MSNNVEKLDIPGNLAIAAGRYRRPFSLALFNMDRFIAFEIEHALDVGLRTRLAIFLAAPCVETWEPPAV